MTNNVKNNQPVKLARVLGLPALVIYGLVMIQPTAPMPLFGIAAVKAQGHVVTLILIGMVAMFFTALSYGRMANIYPSAGSAYTYVGRELHPSLGYVTGWSMIFDYVMNPVICVIWCSKATADLGVLPLVPLKAWFVFYALLFTSLNLRGIKSSAHTNNIIAGGLILVILWFLVVSVRYLVQHPPAGAEDWIRPFYNPSTFSLSGVSSGAALAVLTYIGFDGISTLAEEARNPRRNILLATVLVCVIIGILSAVQVYMAQMVWPEPASQFPSIENAFAHVAKRAGGQTLFSVLTVALLVASMGSGMGAHLGAGRLLYGMGRDNAIPKQFFGHLNPRTHVPSNNIILIGIIALAGAFVLDYKKNGYDMGAQLLNFGAMVGFMGVNVAALTHYFIRGHNRRWHHLVVPVLGFSICFFLWVHLSPMALWIGLGWLTVGLLYGAWRTNGFRKPLAMFRGEESRGDAG